MIDNERGEDEKMKRYREKEVRMEVTDLENEADERRRGVCLKDMVQHSKLGDMYFSFGAGYGQEKVINK